MNKPEYTGIEIEDGDIVHTGGEVGDDASTLASKNSSKIERSKAGSDLEGHKKEFHS